MRDARAEAFERLGGRYDVRVLEPSPPTVDEAPWFADDPVAIGPERDRAQERDPALEVVSPVGNGDRRWEEVAAGDTELESFCRARWLGPCGRLGPAPAGLPATRAALHRLGEQVISPARQAANGKIGLRFTLGGFGTPFFGPDIQVRVERDELVVDAPAGERRAPITSLAAAAEHVGGELLPAGSARALDQDELRIDPEAAAFLGDLYGFAASVLEELRAEAGDGAEASRVQLWPEHFDMAVELGSEQAGRRAAYGVSPGDEGHPEPYVYVAPWTAPAPGELWQARGFPGAQLDLGALVEAEDQRSAALKFLLTRFAALREGNGPLDR